MIFDFHRHLSPTFDVDVRVHDIRGACIQPSWIDGDFAHHAAYLDRALALRDHSHIPVYVFGAVDFQQPPERLASMITQHRLAGVKIHPAQEYPLQKTPLAPYMSVIEHAHVPLYIHTNWEPSRDFGQDHSIFKQTFVQVARWFPRVPIILGHAGNNDEHMGIKNWVKHLPNVYVETSMAPVPSEITKVVKRIGSERVLFGSNAPHASYTVERKKIEVLVLPVMDKQNILHNSGKALMGGGR